MITKCVTGFKLGLALATVALVNTACHENQYGPPANRAPRNEVENYVEVTNEQQVAAQTGQAVAGLSPSADYNQILDNSSDFNTILNKVLKPVGAYVMNKNKLSSSAPVSLDFFEYMGTYNRALLKLAEIDPTRSEIVEQYRTYEKIVLAPCIGQYNACQTFYVMSRESHYSQVLTKLIDVLKVDLEKAWLYQFYALDYSVIAQPEDFQKQFYVTFEKYLQTMPNDSSAETLNKIADASRKLNMIVLSNNVATPILEDFLERIDIWSVNPKITPDGISQPLRDAMRRSIWQTLLQSHSYRITGKSPSFAAWQKYELDQIQAEMDSTFNKTEATKRVKISLQVKNPSAENSDLTFIFNELYTGRLEGADASTLIRFTSPSLQTILNVAQQFVRMKMAEQIVKSNLEMGIALQDSTHFLNRKELQESLKSTHPIEVSWTDFLLRLTPVNSLIQGLVGQRDSDMTPAMRQQLLETFSQLDRDIHWFSSFPHMLPVLHHVAINHFGGELQFWWGQYQTDADTIFTDLFEEHLKPWFNFTGAGDNIDPREILVPEVLTAFNNALATEVFDAYGMKPSDFILATVDRLLTSSSNELEDSAESIYRRVYVGKEYDDGENNSRTDIYQKEMRFCKGDHSQESMYFADLQTSLVGFMEPLVGSMSRLRIYDMTVGGQIYKNENHIAFHFNDEIRTTHTYYIEVVEKMLAMYKAYLTHYNLPPDDNVILIETQLAQVRGNLRKYLGLVFKSSREYGNCLFYVTELIRERELKAYKYEFSYLRQAFRDLQSVQQNPSRLDSLNAKYRKHLARLNIESADHFENVGGQFYFAYNKGDFMERLIGYLQKGAPDDPLTGEKYPAIAPQLKIDIPTNIKTIRSPYIMDILKGDQKYNLLARENETEHEFITDAMVAFFNTTGFGSYNPIYQISPFADWNGTSMAVTINQDLGLYRMYMEASLMRLGEVEVYDFDKPGCNPHNELVQLDEKCLSKTSFEPEEFYKEQLRSIQVHTLTPEFEEIFKMTKTVSVLTDRHHMINTFFSGINDQPIGILDIATFQASAELGGSDTFFPGDPVSEKVIFRKSTLQHARTYHTAYSTSPAQMFPLVDELDPKLREFYSQYIVKNFELQLKFERLAESLKDVKPIEFKIEVDRDAVQLPVRTDYSPSASSLWGAFQGQTDMIFNDLYPNGIKLER